MEDWKQAEAQKCLGEVVRRAKVCGPQHITGSDGEAVLLSAADYDRLLNESGVPGTTFCGPGDRAASGPVSFLEFMQNSPLAEAIRAGDIDLERYPDWPRGV